MTDQPRPDESDLRQPILQKAVTEADSRPTSASPGNHKYRGCKGARTRGRELEAHRHCRSHHRRHGCRLCGCGAVPARETQAKYFTAATAAPSGTAFPDLIAARRTARPSGGEPAAPALGARHAGTTLQSARRLCRGL
jgi:hypothetical protein